jgi:predicted RNA binding protein YcfA (HicA-like mRNA interferase family)
MGRPTPGIENRQFHRILHRNGCQVIRTTGGHAMWKGPKGDRFTTVGYGRPNAPTFKEVAAAAKALGMTIEELKAA